MQRSENISALATALSIAQGEIEGAKKSDENPHFKSKYADLQSVWTACRAPLAKNGLSIVQFPRSEDGVIQVETVLAHKSGEWMSETLSLPVNKRDAQGYGSAMTYARRYALMAVVGIAPEDDDGNAAVGGATPRKAAKPQAQAAAGKTPDVKLDAAKPEKFDPVSTEAPDVKAWCTPFSNVLKKAPTIASLDEWVSLNEGTLALLEKAAPKLRERLNEIHSGRAEEFAQSMKEAAE